MTSSNGNIFRVTGPLCGEFTGPGEFPAQRPVTRSFDGFFDRRPNKRFSKQPWGWWFETPSWSLWRQCNDVVMYLFDQRICIFSYFLPTRTLWLIVAMSQLMCTTTLCPHRLYSVWYVRTWWREWLTMEMLSNVVTLDHDDVITWKLFLRYWPFALGIHRSPVNSPHKGQWHWALMFSLISACIKGWAWTKWTVLQTGSIRWTLCYFDPNTSEH